MNDDTPIWSEAETVVYRDLSHLAVPERERQIAIIAALVQAADVPGAVLDLCCGEGLTTKALLDALADVHLLAYDGSETMLAETHARSSAPDRITTKQIDLAATGWRRFDQPLRAVVSSLAIHHLDGAEKQVLFADIHSALAPGGVFVLADVLEPATAAGYAIAANMWDEEVKRRSKALDGSLQGFAAFQETEWNHFHHQQPDPIDKPSLLSDQLTWLTDAGFRDIDLHWMLAGQFLVSGWK